MKRVFFTILIGVVIISSPCEGSGGKPFPYCDSKGGIRANEKIFRVLQLR